MITIKETTMEDIKNVQHLWADGDVMRFVDFQTVCTKQMKQCSNGLKG